MMAAGYLGSAGRRRRVRVEAAQQPEARAVTEAWAPKWQKLLKGVGEAPSDFTEFDRTVRSMLNRISTENACRLLPLEPSMRGGSVLTAGGDCPRWWATRFAGLMLSSYLQVIHTNRFARGLAVRSADNVLPEYLDAVAPLLAQSPRLVTALMAWFARQLDWHDLCWPTTRLLLLAAREERDRDTLPTYSLGRLPAEVLRGRILTFLRPPPLPAVARPSCFGSGQTTSERLVISGEDDKEAKSKEEKKDVVAVLVHLIMFSPATIWPKLSAFGFSLVEAFLDNLESYQEVQVQIYLAASVLAAIAQRMEAKANNSNDEELRRHCVEDLGPLSRLVSLLRDVTEARRRSSTLKPFVDCRTQVAVEHVRRVQESFQRQLDGHSPIPIAVV